MNKQTAHYHLPGLFEFYELYRMFLPLFREHREYFYDWCDIGSIYGARRTASGEAAGSHWRITTQEKCWHCYRNTGSQPV